MKTPDLIIIGCVKTKIDILPGALVPAMDLYDSPLWRGRRAYAEAGKVPWLILSAEHGLIDPLTEIAAYDTGITSVRLLRHGVTRWHDCTSAALWQLMRERAVSALTLEVHAGRRYVARLHEAAALIPGEIEIQTPVARLQIGEQLRWYKGVTQ